jgi:hypothetical protein
MQNTHGRTQQLLGRAVAVALLVAPFASMDAQYRRDDRDRQDPMSPVEIRRDDDGRIYDDERRREAERRRDAERQLFVWRGIVDDDMRVYVRAANIESRVVSGDRMRREPRVDRTRPLPRREGTLRVSLLDGRGRVQILQQPSARNNWTAIVRVKDAQYGADNYRFVAYFDPIDDYRRDDRYDRDDISYGGEARSGERVMRWTGSVDRDVRIVLRGASSTYSVASGSQPSGVRTNMERSIPRRDGYIEVYQRQGRGTVQVIQQPTRYNDFTAIVRVLDSEGSYGFYDFDLIYR